MDVFENYCQRQRLNLETKLAQARQEYFEATSTKKTEAEIYRYLYEKGWSYRKIANVVGKSYAHVFDKANPLSPRQKQIQSLLDCGKNIEEIAAILDLALATIKRERSRIHAKAKRDNSLQRN